ncbi:MAG: folate-binding protein YgfZ [Rubrivivax sp.]|nr:folate-binding protein YgfZ [Rubrivivax sp.]
MRTHDDCPAMAADDNDRMDLPFPPAGAVRLTDWGLIRASGRDARSFLHGQLTQDVLHLPADRARLAGYCSAKGRLLASFVMWADGDDLLLACSADLLPAALKRLSMFVLRAQCRLSDASAERPLWGLAGAVAAPALGDAAALPAWGRAEVGGASTVRLPDARAGEQTVPRWLWLGAEPPPGLPAMDGEAWQWLEAASGVARIVAATVEQFVPQMVNLELVGGVNFQKGCYPGQEIVARSQYRGTTKRRAYVVHAAAPLLPGQEVFDEADPGQPAGLVVLAGRCDAAPDAMRHAALVELKIAAAEAGTLHVGAADGPLLTLAAQPYALPAAEAA